MSRPLDTLRRFAADARGATAIEYGLILGLLSVVVVGAVTLTGTKLYTILSNVSVKIAGT